MKIAEGICKSSRSVIALGKATFYAQMNLERKEAYKYVPFFKFSLLKSSEFK
jgi:hypothetical protein